MDDICINFSLISFIFTCKSCSDRIALTVIYGRYAEIDPHIWHLNIKKGGYMKKRPANVWVSPRDGNWIVHRENSSRASAVVSTQSEANEIARRIAMNEQVSRITQGRNGRIISHDSYGKDPCPPKDTEH
jgi:hypothetical protein